VHILKSRVDSTLKFRVVAESLDTLDFKFFVGKLECLLAEADFCLEDPLFVE
jgi:hypothetical protein